VSLQDSDKSPSHGAVSAWCVEGDNRGDAHALALVVLAILNLGQSALNAVK